MSTSANVTFYTIKDKQGDMVKEYRQNCMCKDTDLKAGLKSHVPHEDFSITLCWPDYDEVDQWTKEMSLSDYLQGIKPIWVDENGDPKISYEDFVSLQKQLQSAVEVIERLIPQCCCCDKLSSHILYDYDGQTHYCPKHAKEETNAEEDRDLVQARLIVLLSRR